MLDLARVVRGLVALVHGVALGAVRRHEPGQVVARLGDPGMVVGVARRIGVDADDQRLGILVIAPPGPGVGGELVAADLRAVPLIGVGVGGHAVVRGGVGDTRGLVGIVVHEVPGGAEPVLIAVQAVPGTGVGVAGGELGVGRGVVQAEVGALELGAVAQDQHLDLGQVGEHVIHGGAGHIPGGEVKGGQRDAACEHVGEVHGGGARAHHPIGQAAAVGEQHGVLEHAGEGRDLVHVPVLEVVGRGQQRVVAEHAAHVRDLARVPAVHVAAHVGQAAALEHAGEALDLGGVPAHERAEVHDLLPVLVGDVGHLRQRGAVLGVDAGVALLLHAGVSEDGVVVDVVAQAVIHGLGAHAVATGAVVENHVVVLEVAVKGGGLVEHAGHASHVAGHPVVRASHAAEHAVFGKHRLEALGVLHIEALAVEVDEAEGNIRRGHAVAVAVAVDMVGALVAVVVVRPAVVGAGPDVGVVPDRGLDDLPVLLKPVVGVDRGDVALRLDMADVEDALDVEARVPAQHAAVVGAVVDLVLLVPEDVDHPRSAAVADHVALVVVQVEEGLAHAVGSVLRQVVLGVYLVLGRVVVPLPLLPDAICGGADRVHVEDRHVEAGEVQVGVVLHEVAVEDVVVIEVLRLVAAHAHGHAVPVIGVRVDEPALGVHAQVASEFLHRDLPGEVGVERGAVGFVAVGRRGDLVAAAHGLDHASGLARDRARIDALLGDLEVRSALGGGVRAERQGVRGDVVDPPDVVVGVEAAAQALIVPGVGMSVGKRVGRLRHAGDVLHAALDARDRGQGVTRNELVGLVKPGDIGVGSHNRRANGGFHNPAAPTGVVEADAVGVIGGGAVLGDHRHGQGVAEARVLEHSLGTQGQAVEDGEARVVARHLAAFLHWHRLCAHTAEGVLNISHTGHLGHLPIADV